MSDACSRRDFVKALGLASAVSAVLPPGRAAEPQPAPAGAPAAPATPQDPEPAEAAGKRLGVALLGCAHVHTPTFAAMMKGRQDVTVDYVWDVDPARARPQAEDLEATLAPNPQAAWNDPQVSAVVICSETARHAELVLGAAAARKHVFVEKPLGPNASDAKAMASAIEQAGVLFSTGYTLRSSAAVLGVRDLLQAGAFGQVVRASSWFCHDGALTGMFDSPERRWVVDRAAAGVGGFGDIGTHALDVLMWLLGDVEAVAADLGEFSRHYPGCDDTGQAMVRFRGGAMGTVTAGWVDAANPVSLLVSGTEAHAVVLNNALYLKCAKIEGADGKRPWAKLPKGLLHPLHLFLDAVAGKPDQPLVPAREAASRVVVMDAMYESARNHAWVQVQG